MRKKVRPMTVAELRELFPTISFPEYQREPNLWSLTEKQRLIDSVMRAFDIASLYFYEHEGGGTDCVDGRQRIGALMSFLGVNYGDKSNNGFAYRTLNEVYDDEVSSNVLAQGKTFAEIQANEANWAKEFVSRLERYEFATVKLSDSREAGEFNLQFTRLNIGTIISGGEKLNAMLGDLREACYGEGGLGTHRFLEETRIPTRRFSREQLAAQIIAQIFSLESKQGYARTRHLDLQKLFKDNAVLSEGRRETIERVKETLDLLQQGFAETQVLKNRAMTVSTVVLAWEEGVNTVAKASELAEFVGELQSRLSWQVKKGHKVDDDYVYLLDLQRHITQASVEKLAVEGRAEIVGEQFLRWRQTGRLRGDEEWSRSHGGDNPSEKCREEQV